MVEVLGVIARFRTVLVAAIAVRHELRAERDGCIDRDAEILDRRFAGLDQQDVAIRAGRRDISMSSAISPPPGSAGGSGTPRRAGSPS